MTAPLKQSPIINPNIAQHAASNPIASVWVNASAGSGKTSVLTARVTRLLLSGVAPEKILCLTYTRAGAAEMANRVTSMLAKWAVCSDTELADALFKIQNKEADTAQTLAARRLFARVLACPGGLRIRTIHSFCQEILSRFPIEAGLPPHFALIDEQDFEAMRRDVLDDVLTEAGENPHSALAKALAVLVAAQGEHGFDKMLHEVMQARARLDDAVTQAGGEENLIAEARGLLGLEPDDNADAFRRDVMGNLPEAELRQLGIWLLEGSTTHVERGEILADIMAMPPAQRAAKFNGYCGVFLTKTNDIRKQFGDKKILAAHPEITDISMREATRLQSALERIECCDIIEVTAAVLTFGVAFAKKLAVRKSTRAALDYDDLIQFTEKLLHRSGIAPWILYKLDNGIDHILVDEAQDTSRAQWNIVQALTAEFYAGETARNTNRTLFVVGDEKQSIFSFQNADPESFLSLRDEFANHLREAGKQLDIVPMHTSFRSAPAILRAVDAIFARVEARTGVSPDMIEHDAFKKHLAGRVEIWPLQKPVKGEDDGETWKLPAAHEEESDPQAELAQQIADKIKLWLDTKTTLPNSDRPIGEGDIMILLRRRGRFADLMVRALKAQQIKVTGVDRMHLIQQLPVMDLLCLVRFVLLPEDDLNMATLLRSPLIGCSEEDLMGMAIGRKETLWQALKTSTAHKCVADYLTVRLGEADFSTPFAFLSNILNAPCPADTISGRRAIWSRLGDEALDPIEELLNEAQNFGVSHAPSLQNFLHWLTQSDFEIKRELDHGKKQDGHDTGQIRIMTVHASKGLEAPIVFLPDSVALPQSQNIPKLQWDEGAPLFLARQPSFGAAQAVWQRARNKQMEEYRRLFYVALTRSESWLFICGWLDKRSNDAAENSWYGLARMALQPLHQAHAVLDGFADIVVADNVPPAAKQQNKPAAAPIQITLPDWAMRKIPAPAFMPPVKKDVLAKPDANFARGRIIHRLLQSLPDIAPAQRPSAITRFLAQPRHNLDGAQRNEIAQEISRLLQDEIFAPVFAPNALSEAPLTGVVDGKSVFRQVDRLILHDDEVWIVDYKTNRPPPLDEAGIPDTYRQQMAEYRVLLRGIYPDKQVRCFLLWTYAPHLMEIRP